jgi:hypothetical protein
VSSGKLSRILQQVHRHVSGPLDAHVNISHLTSYNHSGGCISGGPGDVDGSGHPADVQLFYYNLGATKIKVKDTASNEVFCVDFGNNPSNNGRITIATCDDNAPGQKLYITDDLHIAVENGPGQCLDIQSDSGIQNVKPYGILKSAQSYQVRIPRRPAVVEPRS